MKRSPSLRHLYRALLLFGLMLSVWSLPSLAQDTPAEDTPEVTAEAADDAAADEAAGDDAETVDNVETVDNAETEDDALASADVEESESPWSTGLITSMAALIIGGLSAVLGIWVDRDKSRPVIFAAVMSLLITIAIGVGATQSYLDAVDAIEQKEDLGRMLNMVSEIASTSGDESLAALVKAEGGGDVVMQPAEEQPAEEQTAEAQSAEELPAEDADSPAEDAGNQ